jgi:hypothetical protein
MMTSLPTTQEPRTIRIEAVNVLDRTAVTSEGDLVAITTLIDGLGGETVDEYSAVAAVGQLSDGTWVAIDLADFVLPTWH